VPILEASGCGALATGRDDGEIHCKSLTPSYTFVARTDGRAMRNYAPQKSSPFGLESARSEGIRPLSRCRGDQDRATVARASGHDTYGLATEVDFAPVPEPSMRTLIALTGLIGTRGLL
jgi:hypothetical protein